MLRSTTPRLGHSARNPNSSIVIMLIAMTLTACGGGGGGGDSSPPPSSPSTQPPPAPTNTAPTVNAGADQTITLPNGASLQGSATDAENNTLTYSWASSPADGVTFASASAASTQATFTNAGTYTLTLTANDGTTTGTDSLQVVVNAASQPPPAGTVFWPGPDVETDPNHGWTAVAPADVGMNAAKLTEAQTYAETGGGAGVIVRGGRLVQKWGDIDARTDLKSASKSMGGIALGIAIDQNLLTLADRAQTKLPGIGADPTDTTPNDPARLAPITIQQLATHTAGFAKDGSSKVDQLYDPGTKWTYSDGGLNWLADTLTNVFQQDLSVVMTNTVWTPLGITTDDLQWRAVAAGARPAIGTIQQRELASGIIANPNAMARIGLLFLRKGMWNGQRIVSEAFVQNVSTPRPETASAELVDPTGFPSANQGYGMLWWTNATKQLADVPADAYWAWGLGDSLIIVIPSLDMVIARTGSNPDDATLPHWRSGWNGNYSVLRPFLAPIVQSVNP